MMSECNITQASSDSTWVDTAWIVKSCILVVILVLVVGGNAALYNHIHSHNRIRKWSATNCMIKLLAACGILNGVINIGVFLLQTGLGQWVLGIASCQVYGVVGNVLLTAWMWFLALAALERYVKLLVPAEHGSLFSEVNTKIMAWGIFLLLLVMYLGPIYGWGEYSYYRGKLDLFVPIKNYTAPAANFDFEKTTNAFFAHLFHNADLPNSTMSKLHLYLSESLEVSLRRIEVTPAGLKLPMRMLNKRTLSCLWEKYQTSNLVQDLQLIMADNGTKHFLKVEDIHIHAEIKEEEYVSYRDTFMPFQESSTCSLDYSYVNPHIYSFVGFSWGFTIILPFFIMAVFYIRILANGLNQLCFYNAGGSCAPDEVIITKVLALSSVVSGISCVPYFATNLTAGLGTNMPAEVHFTSVVLLHFSNASLFILYFLSGSFEYCIQCLFCCYCDKNCKCAFFKSHAVQSDIRNAASPAHHKLLAMTSSESPMLNDRHGRYRTSHSMLVVKQSVTSSETGDNETEL